VLVREFISFQRGQDPKSTLGIGQRHLIEKWLEEHVHEANRCNITINNDSTINCAANIWFKSDNPIIQFPDYIQFNKVDGDFNCNDQKLTSLRGCPYYVDKTFFCSRNNLKSLEYSPKQVTNFYCTDNNGKEFSRKDLAKYCKVSYFIRLS